MKYYSILGVTAAALVSLGSVTANAAPSASLTYTQPTGTAAATDNIEAFVTVTLDANSQTFNDYLADNAGLVTEFESSLLTAGFDLSAGVNFYYSSSMTCSSGSQINTFIGGNCSSGPYDYSFASDFSLLGLTPGVSVDRLFMTFLPKGGVVPGGTYTLYTLSFGLQANGVDANGIPLFLTLADGPSTDDSRVPQTFVRDVAGTVPEPATWALLVLGFGAVGATLRRRSLAVSFG